MIIEGRPIDSVPKDGRQFLLSHGEDYHLARWDDGEFFVGDDHRECYFESDFTRNFSDWVWSPIIATADLERELAGAKTEVGVLKRELARMVQTAKEWLNTKNHKHDRCYCEGGPDDPCAVCKVVEIKLINSLEQALVRESASETSTTEDFSVMEMLTKLEVVQECAKAILHSAARSNQLLSESELWGYKKGVNNAIQALATVIPLDDSPELIKVQTPEQATLTKPPCSHHWRVVDYSIYPVPISCTICRETGFMATTRKWEGL